MLGLEYALFFGVHNNKAELIDGASKWSFPFNSREEAEVHVHNWVETIQRWKADANAISIRRDGLNWSASVAGIEVELFPRPIALRIPIQFAAYEAFHETFYRREYWPDQPIGCEKGWDSIWSSSDYRMNLWSLLDGWTTRHGGMHSGRCDIALGETAGVSPTAFYYRAGRENLMIDDNYFCAVPDLIAELMTASSRSLDRGERKQLYARAGVPNLWLVEPATQTVEVYELHADYELIGTYGRSDSFLAPVVGETVDVDELLKSRDDEYGPRSNLQPIPEWILPPSLPVGLEYFFLLGHPQWRWEFWDNRARSILAFGSADEARARLAHFVLEASHWENIRDANISAMSERVDVAEIGRFRLEREDNRIRLDVAVDGRRYRELLQTWGRREAWDWGE